MRGFWDRMTRGVGRLRPGSEIHVRRFMEEN
jgi:hypothetical protein